MVGSAGSNPAHCFMKTAQPKTETNSLLGSQFKRGCAKLLGRLIYEGIGLWTRQSTQ